MVAPAVGARKENVWGSRADAPGGQAISYLWPPTSETATPEPAPDPTKRSHPDPTPEPAPDPTPEAAPADQGAPPDPSAVPG